MDKRMSLWIVGLGVLCISAPSLAECSRGSSGGSSNYNYSRGEMADLMARGRNSSAYYDRSTRGSGGPSSYGPRDATAYSERSAQRARSDRYLPNQPSWNSREFYLRANGQWSGPSARNYADPRTGERPRWSRQWDDE